MAVPIAREEEVQQSSGNDRPGDSTAEIQQKPTSREPVTKMCTRCWTAIPLKYNVMLIILVVLFIVAAIVFLPQWSVSEPPPSPSKLDHTHACV